LLSVSLSPAFGPCGMPEAAEDDALEVLLDAAGAEDVELAELDDLDEVDEPPPQAASNSAATASDAASQARGRLIRAEVTFPVLSWSLVMRGSYVAVAIGGSRRYCPRPDPWRCPVGCPSKRVGEARWSWC
jgi:hypothetical protein